MPSASRVVRVLRKVGWQAVLVIPLVGLVVPTLYAHSAPKVVGVPFVVWYQFALVLVGLLVTVIAFRAVDRRDDGVAEAIGDGTAEPQDGAR